MMSFWVIVNDSYLIILALLLVVGLVMCYQWGKSAANKKLTNLSNRNTKLEAEHKAMEKEYKSFKKKVNKTTSEYDNLSQRYESLKSDHAKMTKDRPTLVNELNTLRETFAQAEKNNSRLRSELKAKAEKLSESQQKLSAIQKEDKSWKKDLNAAKVTTDDLSRRLQLSETKRAALSKELKIFDGVNDKIKQHEYELKSNAKEIKRMKKDLEYWEKQHYIAHHQLSEAKELIITLRTKEDELSNMADLHQKKAAQAMQLVDEYKSKMIALSEKLARTKAQV